MTVLKTLWQRATELAHWGNIQGVLSWDMETRMPALGADNRAAQLAFLAGKAHHAWTDPDLLGLLDQCALEPDLSRRDRALIRVLKRDCLKSQKIPADLVQACSETEAKAHHIWVTARKASDFSQFAPILKTLIGQRRRVADHLGYSDSPYDALMDDYEPDLTVAVVDPLFARLKTELSQLLQSIQANGKRPETQFLKSGPYDIPTQRTFTREILIAMGFDLAGVRIDDVPHPMCNGTGPGDLALGVRFFEHDLFSGISSTIHEAGHGLYDIGIDPDIALTPLAGGASLGIHESQSRLWENIVGRGKPFWTAFYPKLQAAFPDALKNISLEAFYAAINDVHPSCIRVEADEVTYNLHIILRYEIEKDLIEGKLSVENIPARWNDLMDAYLGIVPPDDAQGCLQDVHWSMGGFGYFPTYTLGNLYAAQFYHQAQQHVPELQTQLEHGNLKPLATWLKNNIHIVSKMETPSEIIQRVTGKPLDAQYFINYLKAKFIPITSG